MAVRIPGGPDPVPGSNRTTRNATVSVRSVAKPKKPKNKKIVWYGKSKPKLDPNKYKVSKRGGGLGYVATRKPVPAPPAAPPAPTGPYAEYADYPWAQQQLKQLDTDQAFQTNYGATKVAPWMSTALANLTGVDPTKPGINPTLQQQYLANVQGQVGGALNAAAAAGQAPQIASTTPGGVMASPTAYLSQAASEGAQGRASSYLQSAQIQSALNTIQPNMMAQSYVMRLGDTLAGLPAAYSEKRMALRSSIDQFIAKSEAEAAQQAETMRHNRVTESISSQNAMTQAALGFGNLGLSTTKEGNDQAADLAAANTPAPYGYVRDPATGNLERDVTVAAADSSAPSTKGTYTPNQLRKEGFSPLSAKAGAKWKQKATVADDGSLWIKAGKAASGGSTASTKKARSAFNLSEDLIKKWRPSTGDGIEVRFDQNPKGAGTWLAQWIRENKASFVVKGKGRKADIAKLRQVLATVGGQPAAFAKDILERGYIDAAGNWK